MKNALVRIFVGMILATSISALALPEKSRGATSAENTCATSPQQSSKTDKNQEQSGNDQEKSREQMQIEEQSRQWLHDLQGIFGG